MKRFLLLLFSFYVVQIINAQNDGDQLFDRTYLHEIRINSPDPDFFQVLIDNYYANVFSDQPYTVGDVIIDGTPIDSVGVRMKGGLSAFNTKKPLKIDFNEFIDGLEYDGVKKFNMQNADFDATVQREAIAYEMFRQGGVKAPRTAHAEVYINDEFHGVYILVEQVDKNFLRNYFADDEGVLYKNKICELEVASGDEDFSHSDEMLSMVNLPDNEFVEQIEDVLDTESFLRYFLIQNFINSVDNPIDVGCNYYYYHDPKDDLIHWIPWDFNLSLFGGANYPLIYDATVDDLYEKMQNVPVYRERYLNMACDFLQYLFDADKINEMIDANADLIRGKVEIDPRYEFAFAEFDAEITNVKNIIANRISQYEMDLQTLNFSCAELMSPVDYNGIVINEFVASNDSLSGIVDSAGSFADWVELFNNTTEEISLEKFYLSDDKDFLKHWRFPVGSSIGGGEYLIVWPDRDLDETGFHADFKLSKDGGQVFLVFENDTVIDSVSYGPQMTNIPYARIPNGTGDFVFHQSTFGADNEDVTAIGNNVMNNVELTVSPNPTKNKILVELKNVESVKHVEASVYNAFGEIMMSRKIQNDLIEINMEGNSAGVYFLKIHADEKMLVEKIVLSD